LTSATNDQGATSLAYDSADHVTQIDYPTGKSLFYTYNDAGLRASISDGGDYNVFYDYDALGRLTSLRDEDSQIVAYEYDGAGNLVREENGNGTVSLYSYDDASRLTRIENQAPDSSINSFNAYTYDAAGQRVTNETQDGTWIYGYDAIGQLTSASFASTNSDIADKSLLYKYDAAGNRTRVVEDGVETLYTANALNQYTQVGDASFTYDADGNMISRTDGEGTMTYTYDLDNRLNSVTEADGTVLEFKYDVFGNRVAKTVDGAETEYLVDPFGLGDVVSEFTGGTLNATYTHGLGLAAGEISGVDAFYDADAVGTVTTLTSTGGGVENRYVVTPFGSELSEIEGLDNDFEFNGALGVAEDSSDLTFMRSRSYSDELGRFLSEDPFFVDGDAQNLYRFAFNDPSLFADPNGEVAQFILGGLAALAFIGGVAGGAATRINADAGNNGEAAGTAAVTLGPSAAALLVGPSTFGLGLAGSAGFITGFVLFGSEASAADAASTERQAGSPSGGSDGDPHIRTFDGVGYSFQAVGEFIFFSTKNGSSEFQVRQEPFGTSTTVSVNTAITARLGDEIVGVYAGQSNSLVVNGTAITLAAGESIAVGTGSVYFDGSAYTITDEFGNGTWARPSAFSPFMNLRPFASNDLRGEIEGLLGNADGDRSNDFALRDGTVLSQPLPVTQLYGEYADAWRIDQVGSLFVYDEGESTETFTDRDFPSTVVTLDDLDPVARADAEAIATAAGLTPGTFEFETTVLDIALTGVEEFAEFVQESPVFQPEGEEIEITPVVINEAPTANPDNAEVDEDGTVDIDVLANDTDPENDPLEILGAGDVNGGTVEVVNDLIRFTPAAGFSGETVISYQLGDGMGNAVLGSVQVEVGPVPDAPFVVDDIYAIEAGGVLNIDVASGLLSNDTDDDGDILQVVSTSDPANGALNVAADGSFSYTPNPGFVGTENIVYSVSDGLTTVDGQLVINVEGTIEPVLVSIGDAPLRVSRSNPDAWQDAWSDEGIVIGHKSDYLDVSELWSSVTLSGRSSNVLNGGDIFGGDLGVSGQSLVSSTIRQEIDGTEALGFDLNETATRVTIDLSRLDGDASTDNFDAGRLQLFDDGGLVIDELIFSADSVSSDKQITFGHDAGFSSVVLTAGVYNEADFIFGGLADVSGLYQSDPVDLGNGAWNGSDYLVDAIEFEFGAVAIVGTSSNLDVIA